MDNTYPAGNYPLPSLPRSGLGACRHIDSFNGPDATDFLVSGNYPLPSLPRSGLGACRHIDSFNGPDATDFLVSLYDAVQRELRGLL